MTMPERELNPRIPLRMLPVWLHKDAGRAVHGKPLGQIGQGGAEHDMGKLTGIELPRLSTAQNRSASAQRFSRTLVDRQHNPYIIATSPTLMIPLHQPVGQGERLHAQIVHPAAQPRLRYRIRTGQGHGLTHSRARALGRIHILESTPPRIPYGMISFSMNSGADHRDIRPAETKAVDQQPFEGHSPRLERRLDGQPLVQAGQASNRGQGLMPQTSFDCLSSRESNLEYQRSDKGYSHQIA